jgi:hypothetical protein
MVSISALFERFREIVFGDAEFISRTGELYDPVCVAYKELRSGRSDAVWYEDFGDGPPHATGPDVLFIGFTAAEPEFYGSVSWPFETAFLDLRVEGIRLTNLALPRDDPHRERLPRSLIQHLRWKGIADGDETRKDAMRKRITAGKPFTAGERNDILHYCLDDVLLLERLAMAMLSDIDNLGQALVRGEYVKFTAEMFCRGIPADAWAAALLRSKENRAALRLRAVSDTKLTHGLYTGPNLTQLQMREFLTRHGLDNWRTTAKSGRLATAHRDFVSLEQRHPEFEGLADARKTIEQLHELQLFAGPDGRYRAPLWAFSTITSRAAPNGAAFPFTTPAWCRYTIVPGPGRVLAYLDFSGMEFGVAAALSRCDTMLADYAAEPYLVLPIRLGLLPPDATKTTHEAERDRYKPMILALQYGGGVTLIERRLGLSNLQAHRLHALHHQRYAEYWEYSDHRVQRAFEFGELITPDGWRTRIVPSTSIFTARNWLIQATAAAIFRYAGLLMRHLGVLVIAPVHDAVLLEAEASRVDQEVARAVECLQRASRQFLHGVTLRVDVKQIAAGQRFEEPRGARTWSFVERSLRELEEGLIHAG